MTQRATKITDAVREIYSRIQYSFITTATVIQLRECLFENGLWSDSSIFHKFIHSVANNEPITEDHPEWKELATRTDNVHGAVKNKSAHIRDMLANGIRDPLELFFDDNGLFYYHGFHRLCVAEHMNLETVKIKICLCSDNLVAIANGLFDIYDGDYKYYLYQPLKIPAFAFCKMFNPNIGSKVNAIAQHIHRNLPFVDFGAHLGYVTRILRDSGYNGTAVEVDKHITDLQQTIEKLTGAHIPYNVCTSIESYMAANKGPCVGIFCSILHHYFKGTMEPLEQTIVPWMQANCVQAFVEHDFHYEKTTLEVRLAYWDSKNFIVRPIFTETNGQLRTILKLTNKSLPYRTLRFDEDAVMIVDNRV